MPMIYGEGQHAFKRLQLEIMKESCDQSIFAWTAQRPNNRPLDPRSQRGLLAYSPAEFERAHHVVQSGVSRTEFSMTNMGMKIKLPVLTSSHCHMPKGSREKVVVAVLNCQDGPDQIELVDLQQIIEHGGTKIEFYVPQTTPPAKGSLSPYQWLVLFLRRSPRPTKPSAHRTAGSDYLVPWQMGKIDATVKVDGSDCSGGAMVFSNSVGYMFGVYVNIHEQSFFYDIRFDLGLEDLDCMEKGHWRKEGIPMSPQSDRRSFPLKGEQMLNFAVRPGLVDGAKAQFVEVSPGGDFQLKQFVPGLLFAP
ncbi:hypothetical protein DL98DRAFT_589295 [Cadophora sp. DSE1049]|nr:hypothetical protein DL98DRAFT_589295 [Cadophora sp. DSE1049]